jgi:hypothetical protein
MDSNNVGAISPSFSYFMESLLHARHIRISKACGNNRNTCCFCPDAGYACSKSLETLKAKPIQVSFFQKAV